ncbi:MAG TPA: hypothetical protein ENI92_07750, partial [Bacteroidetes bacterium]|nr:hypothetical protein [Bacteroidota bacterium]
MKRWTWTGCAVFVLLAATVAWAAPLAQEQTVSFQVGDRILTSSGYEFELSFAEPRVSTVGTAAEPVTVMELPEGILMAEEGEPMVPVAGRFFRLPPSGGVTVEVLDAEYVTLRGIDYAAYFGDESPDALGKVRSPVDAWFPGTLAEASEPAILHDFRISSLITYPVQVNPALREVRVYNNLRVQIRFNGEDDRNALPAPPTRISEAFLPVYRDFLDWDERELDGYQLVRGAVQVLVQNNSQIMLRLEPWIEWKRQKGWELDFLTDSDVSWSASSIRSALQTRWNQAETKYDYIVIIGDASGGVMTPPASGQGDELYGHLAGSDNLVDVGIGRISVASYDDITKYVHKVLSYERDVDMGNTGWYHRGMLAAGSSLSGISTVFLSRYARHAMLDLGYTDVDTAWYYDYPSSSALNNFSINKINTGVSLYGYRGWLGQGISESQINGLTNTDMTPVVVDVTCGTGNWVTGLGKNEVYIRAGTMTSARGAIGAIGTATSGTHTRFNNSLVGGAYYSMLVQRNRAMGDIIRGAKINLWMNYHIFEPGQTASFSEWCNLMGDPTVWVWTDIPHLFTVNTATTMELGTNFHTVEVLENDSPVEGAWVTFYKVDNDEEVITTGTTGPDGMVTLEVPVRFTGDATLTVTAQNFKPEQIDITVTPPAERVGYVDVTYQDNGAGGTSGNANGVPEAGETVGLIVTAHNYGGSTASGFNLSASSWDPFVSAVNGIISYTDIAPDAESTGTGMILVEIAPDAQHEWDAELSLVFSNGTSNYEDVLRIPVSAPQLVTTSVHLPAGGIPPGQNGNVSFTLSNVGGSDMGVSNGVLVSLDPFLTVAENEASVPAMPVGGSATTGNFLVAAHPTTVPGRIAHAQLIVTSGTGQVDTAFVSFALGNRVATDPEGPDNYGYYAFDNTDTEYDLAPTYDWVEIKPGAPGNDYTGVLLGINDTGDDDDEAVLVQLPFTFQYYGEEFTEITVSANGMIAMGDQTDMALARNWTIPSPLGPNYMIAPYWDERMTTGGGGVYAYYDAPNGRYIIEWYSVPDGQGSNPCTFELILYDQVPGHATYSGDNEILFQYATMNHSSGWYHDNPYWTTGIENGDQSDGLQLAFWLAYSSGTAPITNGRAILITTNVRMITGSIQGTVTRLDNGEPIEGLTVRTTDYVFTTTTDENGQYLLG